MLEFGGSLPSAVGEPWETPAADLEGARFAALHCRTASSIADVAYATPLPDGLEVVCSVIIAGDRHDIGAEKKTVRRFGGEGVPLLLSRQWLSICLAVGLTVLSGEGSSGAAVQAR